MNEYHPALSHTNHHKRQMTFVYTDEHSNSALNNKLMFLSLLFVHLYSHLRQNPEAFLLFVMQKYIDFFNIHGSNIC